MTIDNKINPLQEECPEDVLAEIQKLSHATWKEVLEENNWPLLGGKPILSTHPQIPTAVFSFADNSITINPDFVYALSKTGLPLRTALKGVQQHEIGHYMTNPYTLGRLLVQLEAAESYFPSEDSILQNAIVNYFSDVAVNLETMRKQRSGKDLRETIKALMELPHCSDTFKLIAAFYADRLGDEVSFDISYETPKELEEKIKELRTVDFWNEDHEPIYIKQFGDIMMDILKGDREKARRDGGSQYNPFSDYESDIFEGVTDNQLEDALNEIAERKSIHEYERIKRFVNGKTGKQFGEQGKEKSNTLIGGLESSTIEWNNNLVDVYTRKARGKGIIIHKKLLAVDASTLTPDDIERYKVGDPAHLFLPYSSPGILPSITKRIELNPTKSVDKQFTYPDLFISLDTSGSMMDPRFMSHAVLAAFVLSLNYYMNSTKVGVMNFSCDSAFLFPTRELGDVHKLLCAYWGGGTVYDVKKIKEYINLLSFNDDLGIKGYSFSDKRDYERLLSQLDPEKRKEFEHKQLDVNLNERVNEVYEKLDHVMITDGGICNLGEVINYFNSISSATRNTILVTGNRQFAAESAALGLRNTQVFSVDNDKDLSKIAIGYVKKMNSRDR